MTRIQSSPYNKDYEITDAIFGAFRTSGSTAYVFKLMGWMTFLLSIVGLIAIPMMLGGYMDLLSQLARMKENPEDFVPILNMTGSFLLPTLLLSAGYILIVSIVRSAFYRTYFFDDAGGVFPFRLGHDELRQVMAMLGFSALFLLFLVLIYSIILIVLGILFGISTFLFGDEPSGLLVALSVLVFILLNLCLVAAMIWFLVRLAPAGALTALRGKTHILAARRVSKNRFWPLLGSFLVAGIIGHVVSYVAMIIAMMIGFAGLSGSDVLTIVSGLDPAESFNALSTAMSGKSFRISAVIGIILVSAGYAFYSLILCGPSAFFTRQWAETGSQ